MHTLDGHEEGFDGGVVEAVRLLLVACSVGFQGLLADTDGFLQRTDDMRTIRGGRDRTVTKSTSRILYSAFYNSSFQLCSLLFARLLAVQGGRAGENENVENQERALCD